MLSLVYASSAVGSFSTDELLELLSISRRNNERLGVTGMLLHRYGNFVQALEGEEATVEALFERIARDPRHQGIITLLRAPATQREFEGWAMGFGTLDDAELRRTPGYSDFLDDTTTPWSLPSDGHRAQKLLRAFRNNMRSAA